MSNKSAPTKPLGALSRHRGSRTLIEVHHGTHSNCPPDPGRDLNRLVGLGFRCGMTCLRPSAGNEAAEACDALRDGLCRHGLTHTTASCFLSWSLAVLSEAKRPIIVLPIAAAGFSRDECLAVSLVAACQHDTCPALRACAMALLGTDDPSRALAATGELAKSLLVDNRWLDPSYIASPEGLAAATEAQRSKLLAALPSTGRPH